MPDPSRRSLAAVFVLVALAGCTRQVAAPTASGVCWQATVSKDGQVRFNKLSDHEPNMESCAAALEGMRLKFLNMGGSNADITGAYQGNFLFIGSHGVFMSQTLNGNRYFALGRTDDGRLATAAALAPQQ